MKHGTALESTVIDLSIIIVNWNVRELLRRCLTSIVEASIAGTEPGTRNLELETIVVDNASSDGSLEMLQAEFPWVRLIANERNVGFTRANNQGLALSRGRYVLFLNPDTEIVGDALPTMVRTMEARPTVGALGPQLRYPDGTVQSSRRRFPTLTTAFFESTLLAQWWPENPWARRYRLAERPDDLEQEVDWLVGACLLVRREALEQVGGFDEGFFMYSEEMDLCRRLRAAGWRVVYLPSAQVIHHEGRSSEQVVPERHLHFQTSKVRYFRKHHGRLQAELLRLFLLLTYVYQMVEEGLKWLLGHKRPLRAARVRVYWQVLRSRLRDESLPGHG
ncbi:MAG: glycosyltransferase family 2 protein [Anaerolineae bacterium]|nr:glycosyltransferase family 2 protein [Anaerolineae bacterium]